MNMLKELGNDVMTADFYNKEQGLHTIHVDLNDFEGFDDDWCEVMRDYDDAQRVDSFIAWLDDNCIAQEGDYYVHYTFEGFVVVLGYTSYDI